MRFQSRRRSLREPFARTAKRGAHRGMTLIDVTVSMVLLSGVALGMGAFVSQYSKAASTGSSRTVAVELAADRIQEVLRATRYDSLEAHYAGTEASIAGHPGFSRRTTIRRIGGGSADAVDYKLVTVIVNPPATGRPVKKTTAIGTF